ncbi:MAG: hydrogenase small subunit [Nitrospiraceae bacterium]|nr:hydrogenase small subunit [Nitrospiraceae bacterium]
MEYDRRSLFARALGHTKELRTTEDEALALQRACEARLREVEAMEPLSGLELAPLLTEHKLSRRAFIAWTSAMTAALMLPPLLRPQVAKAATLLNRIPVIWIEGQDCAGNSEAFIRSSGPTVEELLFQTISLEFHETLMAAAGIQAEQRKQQAAQMYKGSYILVIEGGIPLGENGGYCTIGASGQTFVDEVRELSGGAALVLAAGACAFYGGIPASNPNPTDAVGVSSVVSGKPLINIPACPMNPVNFVGTLIHYVLTGSAPALDSLGRPIWAFGNLIHNNCERRAHFDAGEYVQHWGDAGAQNNFCLYKMGCKGPFTYNNCSIVRYNEGTNWPIGVGHGCIGCSQPQFWDTLAYERPMTNASIHAPGLAGWGVESSVDEFGLGLLAVVGVGIVAHAIASAAAGHRARQTEPPAAEVGAASTEDHQDTGGEE